MHEFYEKIDASVPKQMEGFSKFLLRQEDVALEERKYEKLIEKYRERFFAAIDELLDLWDSPEHRATLGHDNIHISYDLLEFLYLIKGTNPKQSEKYITVFGSLLHDLGRYPELLFKERSEAMDFEKGGKIQTHAALSGYFGILLARKFKVDAEKDPEIIEASKAFNRRVIGAALFHGGKNEESDPVVHHVQSIDRLAGILGDREFVRNVITDGVQRGAVFYPDERLSYATSFPLFNNLPVSEHRGADTPDKSWTNIVHYIEMPLRNIYSLSSTAGDERAKPMKRESGIILTLLSGGKKTKLYKEIFAPELNPEQDFSFPKTRLPDDIWAAINLGLNTEETNAMKKYGSLSLIELIDLMLAQQAPQIPAAERNKVYDLFDGVPDNHKKHVRKAVEYVVARCQLNKAVEKSFVEEQTTSPDPLIAKIANRLKKSGLFL